MLEDYVCARRDLISIEFSQFRQRGNQMRPCQECPHFCRMEWNLYQLKGTSPKPVAAWSSTKIAPSGRQLLLSSLLLCPQDGSFLGKLHFCISTVFYVLSRQNLLFVRSLREHSLHIRNASTSLDLLFLHTTAKTLFRPNVH